ncbi:hypothetical protein CRM22_010499 [Opisthorchis felineus]|uniref:Apple domain-containing protein n=1 Tax=Opisthorchis felineus TaxID=147828 RepID=A0A4S2L3J6_OPIFE|nr:hypothetical protein CRM22_010499 [Opisthorchis felineus]
MLSIIQINTFFLVFVSCCPDTLIEVSDNVCMLELEGEHPYCVGHFHCQEKGRELGLRLFMVGRNADKLPTFFHNDNGIHTGLHSLLLDVDSRTTGFQVTDPRNVAHFPESDKQQLFTEAPVFGRERIVEWRTSGFQNVLQNENKRNVVCELSYIDSPEKLRTERFEKSWPQLIRPMFMGRTGSQGCWFTTSEQTLLFCGLKCHQHPYCRSFYYNEAIKKCRQALYIDSRLPFEASREAGTWIRFGRRY